MLIAAVVFGTTGGGIGGWVISALESRSKARQALLLAEASIKINETAAQQAEKLNDANIKRIQAEMTLQLEQSRVLAINDLQEERAWYKKAHAACEEKLDNFQEEMSILQSRVTMQEAILKANNLTIPG